jgi:S1-C subfamily serine protease
MESRRAVRLTPLKPMLIRPALALLLLLPTTAAAQDLDTALSAMVRISGTRDDTPVRGSGFVVGLDGDKATIVTASHVIEGAQQLEVNFAADLAERFPAGAVLGMEAGNPRGLAVFQVRGALPANVTSLSFEVERGPRIGDALFLLGFPEMAPAPRTAQRVLSARSGTLLLVDQKIGEGFSGGPVLQGGKVVGVVTDMDEQTTYAVNALVVQAALEGWGEKLAVQELGARDCAPGSSMNVQGIDYVRICP